MEKRLKFSIKFEKLSALAVSAPMHATTSASPACTARAARRAATGPLAPPNGNCSNQRGAIPSCPARLTTLSGARVKLARASPSISSLRRPAASAKAAKVLPANHAAPRSLRRA